MELDALDFVKCSTWILSLLPEELLGKVTLTPKTKNGRKIVIEPLVPLYSSEGQPVEECIYYDYDNQFNELQIGDFVSFKRKKPPSVSFNDTQKKYQEHISRIQGLQKEAADRLSKGIKEKLATEIRSELEELTKEYKAKLDEIKEREKLLEQQKQNFYQDVESLCREIEPYRLVFAQEKFYSIFQTLVEIDSAQFTVPENLPNRWYDALTSQGIFVSRTLAISYLVSLISAVYSGSLVLLNGPVGVGKTSIIKKSANLIGGTCKIIPVRPAWIDPTDLLGFFDPIKEVFRPTPFLTALKDAKKQPEKLTLICLDELNLARIENYGADLLSALEYSRSKYINEGESKNEQGLLLYSESIQEDLKQQKSLLDANIDRSDGENQRLEQLNAMLENYPSNFLLSPNTIILGTLNSDETTYELSPKIIDRSYVINFPVADFSQIALTKSDMTESLYIPVSVLYRGVRQQIQLLQVNEQTNSFQMGWAKVVEWNKSIPKLGIPLGHRAKRDFEVIWAVCKWLNLQDWDYLGHFLFTKLLPRISFPREKIDRYNEWISKLKEDFKELETQLENYDPGDVLDQIQAQVDDSKRPHIRYWIRT